MQRMFAEPTDWQTPWMNRVLPQVCRLAAAHPERTIFTRFIPAARLVPPAEVVDKTVYSPWLETGLDARLRARAVDTLIVTGAETDVCVLAAVLGGVDLGYRIVLATDALCSSCDAAHDALLLMYRMRYGHQVETMTTAEILDLWH